MKHLSKNNLNQRHSSIREIIGVCGAKKFKDFLIIGKLVSRGIYMSAKIKLSSGEFFILREGYCLSFIEGDFELDLPRIGRFNTGTLASVSGIDYNVFDLLKKTGKFEEIGKFIVALGKLPSLVKEYVSEKGLYFHFSACDSQERKVSIKGDSFIIFRTK